MDWAEDKGELAPTLSTENIPNCMKSLNRWWLNKRLGTEDMEQIFSYPVALELGQGRLKLQKPRDTVELQDALMGRQSDLMSNRSHSFIRPILLHADGKTASYFHVWLVTSVLWEQRVTSVQSVTTYLTRASGDWRIAALSVKSRRRRPEPIVIDPIALSGG